MLRGRASWSPSCLDVSSRAGALPSVRAVAVDEMSGFVKRFLRAACGEACMLAARFLDSRRDEFIKSAFIRRLCAGAANFVSLFIPSMSSIAFQCRCFLFWMLRALEPVSMCARIVHSTPPLFRTSYQLHSSLGRSLREGLYLRIFSSSSISSLWVKSAQADSQDHSALVGPVILMLAGRLGFAWLFECTTISFLAFFSLARTGQTRALNGSRS
ncbi:hypothetical protein CY35_07G019600 [Sphagnum magellanicum]|uniref:Uncharacterized protein n=1 Tax=Sphagnum magellanicum TaxID=128215 RepID=A0ACB8HJA5_9BRYO|nr:hypothetical protein CY35_07G019600 [Sphagnum magellanicum]